MENITLLVFFKFAMFLISLVFSGATLDFTIINILTIIGNFNDKKSMNNHEVIPVGLFIITAICWGIFYLLVNLK
jgi:hypothetical protein